MLDLRWSIKYPYRWDRIPTQEKLIDAQYHKVLSSFIAEDHLGRARSLNVT